MEFFIELVAKINFFYAFLLSVVTFFCAHIFYLCLYGVQNNPLKYLTVITMPLEMVILFVSGVKFYIVAETFLKNNPLGTQDWIIGISMIPIQIFIIIWMWRQHKPKI
jgi:hypothetical protein